MTHPDTLTIPRAVVEQALKRAYQLGQTYWQQADSDSWTQNKKSDETQVHFNALVTKTCEALQPQAADDKIKALAAKAPKDVRIYPGGGEVIPQAASDCRTCQHLSEAWGVCEARPKCVGGEQYVYFPEKQLWDKTPRNDGQAAHQEMREALYAEFNRAVGRQHD